MARVFVSVGSNVEPEKNVRRAVGLIAEKARVVGVSTLYETEPIGRPEQARYFNGVVEIETDASPLLLKCDLESIEAELGRVRTGDKYAQRTIDLDILLYDNLVISDECLTIPDPDIVRRPFLARALCELDSNLILPDSGLRIKDIAESVENVTIVKLNEFTDSLRNMIDEP